MRCDGFKSQTSSERCEIPASFAFCANDGARVEASGHICIYHKKQFDEEKIDAKVWRLEGKR